MWRSLIATNCWTWISLSWLSLRLFLGKHHKSFSLVCFHYVCYRSSLKARAVDTRLHRPERGDPAKHPTCSGQWTHVDLPQHESHHSSAFSWEHQLLSGSVWCWPEICSITQRQSLLLFLQPFFPCSPFIFIPCSPSCCHVPSSPSLPFLSGWARSVTEFRLIDSSSWAWHK